LSEVWAIKSASFSPRRRKKGWKRLLMGKNVLFSLELEPLSSIGTLHLRGDLQRPPRGQRGVRARARLEWLVRRPFLVLTNDVCRIPAEPAHFRTTPRSLRRRSARKKECLEVSGSAGMEVREKKRLVGEIAREDTLRDNKAYFHIFLVSHATHASLRRLKKEW